MTEQETGQVPEAVEDDTPVASTHVPDPTAMSGTLETSGTGGGRNERITGTTNIFGRIERDIVAVRNVVLKDGERVVETVEHVLRKEPDPQEDAGKATAADGKQAGKTTPAAKKK
jgi:hypothetical protein